MLMPSKTKYRKRMKGRSTGEAYRGNKISFGFIAIQATSRGFITSRQIEASRRAIKRCVKRGGKLWIRIFPDRPVTARPAETRMGKGKGSVDHWNCLIQPGRILFEMDGVNKELATQAFKLAQYKLPVKTTIINREDHL